MLIRILSFSLVMLLSASHLSYAEPLKPKSISDRINSTSFEMINQSRESIDAAMQSCKTDKTAVITVYSVTGKAQVDIDVKLDNNPIGSLTTYYPDGGPECKTLSSKGVITIIIPAGKHTLEAKSLNLVWPDHTFTIQECECMVLPLY